MNRPKFKVFLPLIGILLVYFSLRLQNILTLPVFCDEAIYVRWSQIIKSVETLRFIPLTDGKQPLFMWLTASTFKFITDPLLAGRLVSIFAGAGIISVLYTFCILFFNPTTAIFSSLIYLFLPFSFFFDRLALADNLLSFFGTTSLTLAFALAKYPRLDLSLILGFSLGAAWLTKSPAIYFVILSLITFVGYQPHHLKKIYLPVISSFMAFLIYNVLRLGPQFHQIALRNRDYIWSFRDIIQHPLDPLLPHLSDVTTLLSQYVSWPLIFLALISLLIAKTNKDKNRLVPLVFLWFILPLIANAAMAKVFTARYVLFIIPPLTIILAYFIAKIYLKYPRATSLLFLLCLLPNFYTIYRLSFRPQTIYLPSTEVGYVSTWTSGWGIKEASTILIERSQHANVIVGTEGYFGTLPDGLQIYTNNVPQLTVFGVGIDINKIPDKLIDARQHGDEVYLLFNRSRLRLTPTDYESLILIKSYDKPGLDQLLLYRLK